MQIQFSESEIAFIKASVEQGLFASETDFVREAVRRMREQSDDGLYDAVMKGQQSLDAGRSKPYDQALMEEIKARAAAAAHSQKPYHSPHATPY